MTIIRAVLGHDAEEFICTSCAKAFGGAEPIDVSVAVEFVRCCICDVWRPCTKIADWAWPAILGRAGNVLGGATAAVSPARTQGSPKGADGRHAPNLGPLRASERPPQETDR